MSDQPQNKKVVAVTVAAIIISAALAVAGAIPEFNQERPRHKGGRRRKKTWIEKQQRKRGWHQPQAPRR